jgi:hypothetical protein
MAFDDLSTLLGLTAQTFEAQPSLYGFNQEFRAHPSAGALHPMHVLCNRGAGHPWERYDSLRHALVEVKGTERLASAARTAALEMVDGADGTLLALVAEPGKTGSKYANHHSLVWRDGGILLGYLSLVSEAMGLAICPLGLSGHAYVAPLNQAGLLQGAGLLMVGSRVDNNAMPHVTRRAPVAPFCA